MTSSERGDAGQGQAAGEGSVTAVIRHQPKPGSLRDYEAWLQEITPIAQRFSGHRGVNIIRPHDGSPIYTIVLHFDALENLTRWFESDVRARLVEEVRPLLASREAIEVKTGLEFWFTPPRGQRHARPYKQFLVTLSAIFPLTLLVPWALQPLLVAAPWLGQPVVANFLIAVIIVGLMTYVIMPRYVRLLADWLFR